MPEPPALRDLPQAAPELSAEQERPPLGVVPRQALSRAAAVLPQAV